MGDSRGLLHVNLNVSNLERSIRFYCEGLGFALVSDSSETIDRGEGPEPIRQAIVTAPGTSTILALTQAASLEVGPKGLNHLGLVLTSDESCARILARIERYGGSIQGIGSRPIGI